MAQQSNCQYRQTDIAACYRLSFEAHFRLVTIHPWVDGNGRTTRLVMNMIQRQLGLIPSIVRKEDKGEYIQSLVDSRENEDSTIAQDAMFRHHIANLNRRTLQYQENDTVNSQNDTVNGLKEGLKKIYAAIRKNPEITHAQLMESYNISESMPSEQPEILRNSAISKEKVQTKPVDG